MTESADATGRPSLPRGVVATSRRLAEAGHVAYLAGGCVRDRLLGLEPKDWDIATDARPDAVRGLFPGARSVGESFGIMLVRSHGLTIEVATFRTDGVYSDGRHPDVVAFTDAEHDATRRDFTINGIFEDPETGAIVDYVGGRDDLAARRVRAIGDPAARLREDRLRMLRAVRFAARFGFALDAPTADAIREGADQLDGVSRERIGHEVRSMLTHSNRAVAAWEMQYLGLDTPTLREPNCLAAPTMLARLPDRVAVSTALAAWLIDRHGEDPVEHVSRRRAWTEALVLSREEERGMRNALSTYRALTVEWRSLGVAAQKRVAASEGFAEAILLVRARDRQVFVDIQRHVSALATTGLAPTPLVTGEDLVEAGFRPGPPFKPVLDAVYDAQLEGAISSAEEGLQLARVIFEAVTSGRRPGPD